MRKENIHRKMRINSLFQFKMQDRKWRNNLFGFRVHGSKTMIKTCQLNALPIIFIYTWVRLNGVNTQQHVDLCFLVDQFQVFIWRICFIIYTRNYNDALTSIQLNNWRSILVVWPTCKTYATAKCFFSVSRLHLALQLKRRTRFPNY